MPRSITITRRQFGYSVNPGTFTVDKDLGLGEDFVLRNRSGLPVKVDFPPDAVCGANGQAIAGALDLQPGKQADIALKINTNFKDQWFEYTVQMIGAGIEAQGNSRPGVEIVR